MLFAVRDGIGQVEPAAISALALSRIAAFCSATASGIRESRWRQRSEQVLASERLGVNVSPQTSQSFGWGVTRRRALCASRWASVLVAIDSSVTDSRDSSRRVPGQRLARGALPPTQEVVRRLVPSGTQESVWSRPASSSAARYQLPRHRSRLPRLSPLDYQDASGWTRLWVFGRSMRPRTVPAPSHPRSVRGPSLRLLCAGSTDASASFAWGREVRPPWSPPWLAVTFIWQSGRWQALSGIAPGVVRELPGAFLLAEARAKPPAPPGREPG